MGTEFVQNQLTATQASKSDLEKSMVCQTPKFQCTLKLCKVIKRCFDVFENVSI